MGGNRRMEPMIQVENLCKSFSTKSGTVEAARNISFSIEKGETLGVVGESGCGKSTLGRTIIHLQEPTAGQIFLNGEDITHVKGKELDRIRRVPVFKKSFSFQ